MRTRQGITSSPGPKISGKLSSLLKGSQLEKGDCLNVERFGPFYIEDKREGTQMYYVCLLTCLVTRAVHLEVCHDLSIDSLLMTISRFVSQRGYAELIVSDNGKNFIGANQAMKLKKSREITSQTTSTPDCKWLSRTFSGLSNNNWHNTAEESGKC